MEAPTGCHPTTPLAAELRYILEGFTIFHDNNQQYLVPTFMMSSTGQALEAKRMKQAMNVDSAGKGVSTRLCVQPFRMLMHVPHEAMVAF